MATLADKIGDIQASQENAHIVYNPAMRWVLAGLQNFRVIDRDLTTPPGSESNGDLYLVLATGTGDWAGEDGNFALYYDAAWDFLTPAEGDKMWVKDENVHLIYNGSTWGAV